MPFIVDLVRLVTRLVGGLMALLAVSVSAAPAHGLVERQLEALRREDLRVAAVTYRLAAAAGDLCPAGYAPAGLLIHDAAQYDPAFRAVAVRLFGLDDGPVVEAVVAGSPAEAAGIEAGDHIVAIDGAPVARHSGREAGAPADHVALDRMQADFDRAFAKGAAAIGLRRNGRELVVKVVPRAGCASTVQLLPMRELDAGADGRLISISTRLVEYTRDENELAMLIGHEMAHNALGHPSALAAIRARRGPLSAGDAAYIRGTEADADRLGLYLMARAGFGIDRAPDLWRRLATGRIMLRSDPTHPGWRERIRLARETADDIAQGVRPKPGGGFPRD